MVIPAIRRWYGRRWREAVPGMEGITRRFQPSRLKVSL